MKHAKLLLLALLTVTLIAAGCDREITGDVELADNSSSNCFTCHSDQDFTLLHAQDQFAVSIHATGETSERNRLNASYYSSCEKCHTHEGFVANVAGMSADGDHFTHIDCFTCHAPHTNGDLTLRTVTAVALENGDMYDLGSSNLCVSCHMSRENVDEAVVDSVEMSSRYGPHHSNQGDMLIGTNAYEYTGYTYSSSWHGQNIDDGCVTCHMAAKTSLGEIGGHTFNVAYFDEDDEKVENTAACVGCHSTLEEFNIDFPADADYDWDGEAEGVQMEVTGLIDSLTVLLFNAGLVEYDAEDDEYSPIGDLVVPDADSAGAVFNWAFVHEDRSYGIHNTDYAVGLLQSAINYMAWGDPNGSPSRTGSKSELVSAH